MPERNKAAMAAVSATTILILLVLAGSGARADTDTGTAGTPPVTVSAEAAPPVPPSGSITLGMLEQIQQKNLLLAAKVQTAQLQRQLEEAGSEGTTSTGTGTVIPPGGMPPSSSVPGVPGPQDGSASSRARAVPRPQVLEISGKGSVLRALLQLPDGSQPEVTTGSRVVIGKATLTVSRISLSGITLSDGTELSF